ncbi:MAG: SH3 domain-containing protein [Deltaproteobacteria bacterium]|nr:SH3 domain-containing protein [Deltaproteobacteria bacterium]
MRPFIKRLAPLSFLLLAFPQYSYARGGVESPSYWIKGLEAPEEVVLNSEEIKSLNRMTVGKTDQMADLNSMPEVIPDWQLLDWLLYDKVPYDWNTGRRFFSDGRRVKDAFLDGLIRNMNLDGVAVENAITYGAVVERADIRAFPTDLAILKRPGRLEFDTVQYSSIYPPEAVALLHTSRDGQWGFVQTGTVRGWIRMNKVAFGDRESAIEHGDDFLVVTGSSIKVYRDKGLKKVFSTVPMGALLDLSAPVGSQKRSYAVRFPQRDAGGSLVWAEAYVSKGADLSVGFLPYTGKNVITQAFKMLGEEYGWGGKDGRRDCSEFIKDLFFTMGIMLPRNSRYQGVSGDVLAYRDDAVSSEEIIESLKSARPGITLLGLDRHIMLYLGERKGKPYAIHQIFGYKDGQRFRILNKVTVTDLELGRRSKAGPLKRRIRSVTEIRIPGAES